MMLGLCVSLQCGCLTSSWLKGSRKLQVKETRGKRDGGEFHQHAIFHHQAVLTKPYLFFPSISYSTSSSSFVSSPSSSCSSSLRRFEKPPGPPSSPAGTCKTGTGLPPPPKGSKILAGFSLFTSYKIVTVITRL